MHAPYPHALHPHALHPHALRPHTLHPWCACSSTATRSTAASRDFAAAALLVSPFVPMLFQGEEWAASSPFYYFAQMESPELRAAIREGRRAEHALTGEVGPDPEDPSTRERSVLRWHERGEPAHAAMLDWYRALIAARRAHPELRDPSPASTQATRRRGLLEIRRGGLRLVCNLTEEVEAAELGDILLASAPLANRRELPPLTCALVRG
jgi:1,4-alpha-glucan branching enzyme